MVVGRVDGFWGDRGLLGRQEPHPGREAAGRAEASRFPLVYSAVYVSRENVRKHSNDDSRNHLKELRASISQRPRRSPLAQASFCLLYTSDAADE